MTWSLLYPASLRMLSLHKASALAVCLFACKHDNVKVSTLLYYTTLLHTLHYFTTLHDNVKVSQSASLPPLCLPFVHLSLGTCTCTVLRGFGFRVRVSGLGFRVYC